MNIKFVMARSVVGFAIGDIIGVPYEFKKRGSFVCDDMRASRWNDAHFILPKGAWSDDTSLLLCVLDSLHGNTKEEVYQRWRKNAICWSWLGKFTNHGYRIPFDIGKSCRIGIDSMLFHRENKKANDVRSNGNGGLMRILPVAFLPVTEQEEILEYIRIFNSCSHNHMISHEGCLIYILLAKELLKGNSFEDSMENVVSSLKEDYCLPEYERIWTKEILKADLDDVKSTGYVVDTLEAVIWCLAHSGSYREAVLKAVNLGEDTDTIGALTGGLAAILYPDLPDEWVWKIRRLRLIQGICNSLGIIQKEIF